MIVEYDEVRASNGTDYRVSYVCALQPETQGHAYVRLITHSKPDPAVCDENSFSHIVLQEDGSWTINGPRPDLRDDSWHPGLMSGLGEYFAYARQLITEIPNCGQIDADVGVTFCDHKPVWSGHANFYRVHPSGQGLAGCVGDSTLDRIAGVRFVERTAVLIQQQLRPKASPEGDYYEGELVCHIRPDFLCMSYCYNENEAFTLESKLVDGKWIHICEVELPVDPSEDAIQGLRRLRKPPVERLFDALNGLNARKYFKEHVDLSAFPAVTMVEPDPEHESTSTETFSIDPVGLTQWYA